MSLPWKQIEKHLHDYRREMGWMGAPCVRLVLKSGGRYLVHRILETGDDLFAVLVYMTEETIDETPRFVYLAIDPEVIAFLEAFEPEPRRPEQLKRLSFSVTASKERTGADPRGQSAEK